MGTPAPLCLYIRITVAQASPFQGPTVARMADWVWNESTGSWWCTDHGRSTNLEWSDANQWNRSQQEPALQEPELAARKELTQQDIQVAKDRRFSRDVMKKELEKLIAQTEQRQQRQLEAQREHEEFCAKRGIHSTMQYFNAAGGPKAIEAAIRRRREANQDQYQEEMRRLQHFRAQLEKNAREAAESPRLDERLVENAKKLILQ